MASPRLTSATRAAPSPGRLLSLRQLLEEREFLTERHVRRLVAERRIPFYKAGAKLVFDLDEIDDWIEATRVPATG
jgi:excisionase family DNA binding protein